MEPFDWSHLPLECVAGGREGEREAMNGSARPCLVSVPLQPETAIVFSTPCARPLPRPEAGPSPYQRPATRPRASTLEGKCLVNLPQMPPLQGDICMGIDERNHPFAPGLPPGRLASTVLCTPATRDSDCMVRVWVRVSVRVRVSVSECEGESESESVSVRVRVRVSVSAPLCETPATSVRDQ